MPWARRRARMALVRSRSLRRGWMAPVGSPAARGGAIAAGVTAGLVVGRSPRLGSPGSLWGLIGPAPHPAAAGCAAPRRAPSGPSSGPCAGSSAGSRRRRPCGRTRSALWRAPQEAQRLGHVAQPLPQPVRFPGLPLLVADRQRAPDLIALREQLLAVHAPEVMVQVPLVLLDRVKGIGHRRSLHRVRAS